MPSLILSDQDLQSAGDLFKYLSSEGITVQFSLPGEALLDSLKEKPCPLLLLRDRQGLFTENANTFQNIRSVCPAPIILISDQADISKLAAAVNTGLEGLFSTAQASAGELLKKLRFFLAKQPNNEVEKESSEPPSGTTLLARVGAVKDFFDASIESGKWQGPHPLWTQEAVGLLSSTHWPSGTKLESLLIKIRRELPRNAKLDAPFLLNALQLPTTTAMPHSLEDYLSERYESVATAAKAQ